MSPSLVLGDVIRRFAGELGAGPGLTSAQDTILSTLGRCRTAVLGGHVYVCDDCGKELVAYNGCGNRHCPSCLGKRSAQWLEDRRRELLPVPYFHVVFTVPEEVGRLALGNKKVVYSILFRAVSETLLTLGADPKLLGAQLGFLAILHTWTQTLGHHPHIHCVVPGGGLSPDGASWVPSRRPDFLLPIRVLSRLYRGKFLAFLDAARRDGELQFGGSTADLSDSRAWNAWLGALRNKEWVVYAKPPFGSPAQVLKYLARYTHRVAISNARLLSMDDHEVRFAYRDRTHGNRRRVMVLQGAEFLRRFVLHLLPRGFVRIRYYGWLANRGRAEHLAHARALLAASAPEEPSAITDPTADRDTAQPPLAPSCPHCGGTRLREVAELPRHSVPVSPRALAVWPRRDTS